MSKRIKPNQQSDSDGSSGDELIRLMEEQHKRNKATNQILQPVIQPINTQQSIQPIQNSRTIVHQVQSSKKYEAEKQQTIVNGSPQQKHVQKREKELTSSVSVEVLTLAKRVQQTSIKPLETTEQQIQESKIRYTLKKRTSVTSQTGQKQANNLGGSSEKTQQNTKAKQQPEKAILQAKRKAQIQQQKLQRQQQLKAILKNKQTHNQNAYLHQDPKFYSKKYRIKALQTLKGSNALNAPPIMNLDKKKLTIMGWNVWNEQGFNPDSNIQNRYNHILRKIQEKDPDIVLLQQVQQFSELLQEFLQDLGRSSYYYSDPSFNSTIILCKVPARFYEMKFSKGMKAKPMSMCQFNIHCRDGKTRSVIVHSVHLKARLGSKATKEVRQLQLRTIRKINKHFDISILGGDFNFDDTDPQNMHVKYSYVDLQLHKINKKDDETLPQNMRISQQTEIKQQEKLAQQDQILVPGDEEQWSDQDSFDGYSDQCDSEQYSYEFEEEQQYEDGYYQDHNYNNYNNNNQRYYGNNNRGRNYTYDRDNDGYYSQNQNYRNNQYNGYSAPPYNRNNYNHQNVYTYDNNGYHPNAYFDNRSNWNHQNPYQQNYQPYQNQYQPPNPYGQRFDSQYQGQNPYRQNSQYQSRQPQYVNSRGTSERYKRGRVKKGKSKKPLNKQFLQNSPDDIWTYLYYPNKSKSRFDRILISSQEMEKKKFRDKVNVMNFERLGAYCCGIYRGQRLNFMDYLVDKIVRSPSDHLGVYAELYLNF